MAKKISKLVKPSSSRTTPELNLNTKRFGVETISCKNNREQFNKLVNKLTDDIKAILKRMIKPKKRWQDDRFINKNINTLYQNLTSTKSEKKYRDINLHLPQYKECQENTEFKIEMNGKEKELNLQRLLKTDKSDLTQYLEELAN